MSTQCQGWRRVVRMSSIFSCLLICTAFVLPAAATAAATEVGAIPGTFDVSNGAASYAIPIKVQPGSAGLAPQLALAYSSMSGNGLAGYGWSLQGLSAIAVCGKTWAQSGANVGVVFSNSATNKYCVNGVRLIPAAGNPALRKELDDFSVTRLYTSGGAGPVPTNGPQYFVMQTMNGLTYTYGKTADSEIIAAGPGVASGVTMARAWALNSISDKYGNSIDYTYQQDTANGDYWPVSITFTDHNGTLGSHKVVFKYTDLATTHYGLVWSTYLGGALVNQTRRLSEIDVDENGVQQFTYTLGYTNTLTDANGNTGTERSLLTSVQECAGGTCLPQTTINWQTGTSGWGGATPANMGGRSISSTSATFLQLMDVNGDGLPDIVYPGSTDWILMIGNGNGFRAPVDSGYAVDQQYYQCTLTIDMNGDGQQELLIPRQNSAGRLDWFLLTPQVNGTSVSITGSDTGRQAVGYCGNASVMDMNGDGLQDLVFSDGTNLQWHENMGGSLASAVTVTSGEFSTGDNGDEIQRQRQFAGATPDFDGTGRGSFMVESELSFNEGCTPDFCPPPKAPIPTWHFMLGGGYNSSPAAIGSVTGMSGNLVTPFFVDFNGDGISDVMYANGTQIDASDWTWRTYESTGTSITGGDTGIAWKSSIMLDSIAVDYSGNGRQQVLLALENSAGNCTSLGLVGYEGGQFQSGDSIGMSTEGPCASGYYYSSLRGADVRGVGLQDLVWVANGTVYYALHRGVRPDLVTAISNNFNQTYNVSYQPLTNGANYTPGNAMGGTESFTGEGGNVAAPETHVVTGPMYVVDSYTANDGVGNTHSITEAYTNALADVLGRGFLGFQSIVTKDTYSSPHTTITSEADFNQLFPLTGTASSSTVTVNGNTLRSTSSTWTSLTTYNFAQYVYASSTAEHNFALGSSTAYLTTTTTSAPVLSGSPDFVLSSMDSITSTNPKSIKTETLTDFVFDDSNWCFALPSSTTTTNTDQTTSATLVRSVTYSNDTAHCQLTSSSQSVVDNSVTQSLQTTMNYDPTYGVLTGKTLTATNAGVQTSYSDVYAYDPSQTFVTSVTNALGTVSTTTWDPVLGKMLSQTDPNGAGASYGYDSFGLMQTSTAADGTTTGQVYCLPANACTPTTGAYSVTVTHSSSTGAAGAQVTTAYDSFFRPVRQTSFVLNDVATNIDTAYDSLGRKVSVSTPYTDSPSAYSVTTYDTFNRPSVIYTPAGQESGCTATPPSYSGETACTVSYQYNQDAGFTTLTTDQAGKVSSAILNAAGELAIETDAFGTVDAAETQYSYDPFGDLLQTVDANGSHTTMTYDTWGRKLSMSDPNMGQVTYVYDPRGLVTSQTDAKGQTITMSYDALGRLVARTVPVATGTSTDSWTYDGPGGTPMAPYIGKVYEVQGGDGYARQYQYDGSGRTDEVDTTIGGTTYSTNTSYDAFGRVASVTYPATPAPDSDDPPTADAGENQSALVGQIVTLSGAASDDPDHGPKPLTYTWTELSGPSEIAAVDGQTSEIVSFSTNIAGVYDFQLTVSDSELTDSKLVTVTIVPAQVSTLTASAVDPGTGNFNLSWGATTGAVNFTLEQSTNGGAFGNLPLSYGASPAPLTGYTDGTYTFGVQGCDASGAVCGAFSSTTSVTVLRTPGAPVMSLITPNPSTTGNFTVKWSQPTGDITHYEIFASTNGSTYSNGINVGNVLSWSPSSAKANDKYYYKVEACNATCSAPSNVRTVTVNRPVPIAPSLSISGTGVVTWTPQGSVSATSWLFAASITTTFSETGATSFPAGTHSTTVSPKVTMHYAVEGCNAAGCSDWSSYVTYTVTIDGGCPPQPQQCQLVMDDDLASSSRPADSLPVLVASAVPELEQSETVIVPAMSSSTAELASLRHAALRQEDRRMLTAQAKLSDRLIPDAAAALAHDDRTLFSAQLDGGTPDDPRLQSAPQAVALGMADGVPLKAKTRTVGTTQRYTVNYAYDDHENLTQVVDAADPTLVYWQADSSDVFGHVTAATFGNGLITTRTYDPNTGMLQAEAAGAGGTSSVLQQAYTWDADGNLASRQDLNAGLTETFTYDNLNRVRQAVTSGAAISTLAISYSAVGNIVTKSDVGTYSYSALHPMQIDQITPTAGPARTFRYDNSNGNPGNGNLMNDGVHSYAWDASNRAIQITNISTGAVQQFAYTPSGVRYQESTTGGGNTTSLTEVDAFFQVYVGIDGHTYDRQAITSPDGVIAVRSIREDGQITTRYLSTDELGSVSATTNEIGQVDPNSVESYDAFGQRRDPTNWQVYACGSAPDDSGVTDKGYTGQQYLDTSCLVHMNGRVYDPQSGRFVSADPTIPGIAYSQSFNRYAYVNSNPLKYTDPSGYCVVCLSTLTNPVSILTGIPVPVNVANPIIDHVETVVGHAGTNVIDGVSHVGLAVQNNINIVIAAVVAYETAGMCSSCDAYLAAAIAGGTFAATATALNGGTPSQVLHAGLRGFVLGGVSGGLMELANDYATIQLEGNLFYTDLDYTPDLGNYIAAYSAYAVAGGLSAKIAGGSFIKGAEMSVAAFALNNLYQEMTNESPQWQAGDGGVVYKPDGPTPYNSQDFDLFGGANVPPKGMEYLMGTQVPQQYGFCLNEGCPLMEALDSYPGMNALATLHDVWAASATQFLGGSSTLYYLTLDVPSMLPAAAISYGALLSTPLGAAMAASNVGTQGHP